MQLPALNEDTNDAWNLLLGHCQVQGRSAVDVLGPGVGPELGQQDASEVGMTLPRGPVQPRHLEVVHVEGQVGIGLQQPFDLLVARLDHGEELVAVVVVHGLFDHALAGYLPQTQVVGLHLCCQLLHRLTEHLLLFCHVLDPHVELLGLLVLAHRTVPLLHPVALLQHPLPHLSPLLLWDPHWHQRHHLVSVGGLLERRRRLRWSGEVDFHVLGQFPEVEGGRFDRDVLLVPEEVLGGAHFVLLLLLAAEGLLDDRFDGLGLILGVPGAVVGHEAVVDIGGHLNFITIVVQQQSSCSLIQ